MMKRALALVAAIALAVPALAQTDVLVLTDGRVFADLEMERNGDGSVSLLFQNGDVLVPARLIQDALIAGDSAYVPETEEEKEKFERGFVKFEGKWIKKKRRDQLIEKRLEEKREEIEAMQAHQEWKDRYMEETKNFRFEVTVPVHVFEGYRDAMEAYFQIFAKDWKLKRPKSMDKLTVCFYGTRKEFHRTGGAPANVGGYFKFYPDFDLNIYYDRLDPGQSEDIMFHEANHYLQKLVDVDFKVPHWPGEALAEYYGASSWDPKKKKLTTGLIQEGRLIEIQNDIAGGEMWGLKKLILDEGAYQHYTWGWSLVHFLMNHKKHEKPFKKFFVGLAQDKKVKRHSIGMGLRSVSGEEILATFQRYLGLEGDEDLEELEAEWHAYIETQLKLVTPSGLEKAAASALQTGRHLRAKRLFEEAIAAGSTNPVTYHKYAGLLDNQNETSAAIENWRRAIELDPLTGIFYYALGSALADDEEGERLKALALEIDPEADSGYYRL